MKPSEEQMRKMENEIEAAESWLAGFATPGPSPDALRRVKQAVRRECAVMQQTPVASRRRWAHWQGALAAAALIMLAVAVGWQASRNYTPTSTPPAFAPVAIQTWSAQTEEETTRFARLDDGLSELEDWSLEQDWSTSGGASLYDALEDALTNGPTDDAGAFEDSPRARGRFEVLS